MLANQQRLVNVFLLVYNLVTRVKKQKQTKIPTRVFKVAKKILVS
jgi:hypothetical protein